MTKKLVDPHGRVIHKLRLSLLDACNFKCVYCMPDGADFLKNEKLLASEEVIQIANSMASLGIDEIRLTGGEPTLRKDILNIIEGISEINLNKFGMTTNGIFMKKLLPTMSKTNCRHLNFSLDSLNKVGFHKLTGNAHLDKVMESIFMAKELGFNVKINCVLMKGLNDIEIEDFIEFSGKYDIEVRFLELMRIGSVRDSFEKYFYSADDLIARLKTYSELEGVELPQDSTSFNYRLSNGANIGIIASESKPFCNSCSRLRISANGTIRPCLMMSDGFSIRHKSVVELEGILEKTMSLKPIDRIYETEHSMYQIGG